MPATKAKVSVGVSAVIVCPPANTLKKIFWSTFGAVFSNDIVSVDALPVIANPVPGAMLSVSTLEVAWTPPPVVIVIVKGTEKHFKA